MPSLESIANHAAAARIIHQITTGILNTDNASDWLGDMLNACKTLDNDTRLNVSRALVCSSLSGKSLVSSEDLQTLEDAAPFAGHDVIADGDALRWKADLKAAVATMEASSGPHSSQISHAWSNPDNVEEALFPSGPWIWDTLAPEEKRTVYQSLAFHALKLIVKGQEASETRA